MTLSLLGFEGGLLNQQKGFRSASSPKLNPVRAPTQSARDKHRVVKSARKVPFWGVEGAGFAGESRQICPNCGEGGENGRRGGFFLGCRV